VIFLSFKLLDPHLGQDKMVRQDNPLLRTMDQVLQLDLGLYFHSAIYVSDHFLVLFCAPWATLISFSIPTLAAGAGTIPSRAGYILSMLNTLISPRMIPLELLC
jgi:hypothetical protein